ncbi:MAG: bifunctional pyr operon transcriptional regulator/uracil phosphoribosyltransferase PyrR [Bacteroidetes bacterium]|nr:bifunctional pyr operon transcriptional regulator/uracil phosphoribosyltransferase PyrR [Bacteroidota bacterium]
MEEKLLYDHQKLNATLHRLAYELIENHDNFANTAIIGLQPRGIFPARLIRQRVEQIINAKVKYGELDITFYRDDFRTSNKQLLPSPMHIPFSTEGLKIILIDDVLFTGRTIRSAMDALLDFGRPAKVELCVLIDRKFNRENPIAPDYVGKSVDTRGNMQKVKVDWEENNYKVWLINA